MKILIVSDTHGRDEILRKLIGIQKPFDMLIHLGDIEGGEERIAGWAKEQNPECQVYMVRGNNDFFSGMPSDREIVIGPFRAFITHGHAYGANFGTERLRDEAKDRNCGIVMFGHTHRPVLNTREEVTVLNPGSLSYPRQEGRRPSFILMEIDREGKPHYSIAYL